jgi:hypothetical protein
MRILELHGQSAFTEEAKSQLALLARFAPARRGIYEDDRILMARKAI